MSMFTGGVRDIPFLLQRQKKILEQFDNKDIVWLEELQKPSSVGKLLSDSAVKSAMSRVASQTPVISEDGRGGRGGVYSSYLLALHECGGQY